MSEESSAIWIEKSSGERVTKIVGTLSQEDTNQVERFQRDSSESLTKRQLFHKVRVGETKELVISKLGKPDNIIEHEANLFSNRPKMYDYEYTDLGIIRFAWRGALQVERVTPLKTYKKI